MDNDSSNQTIHRLILDRKGDRSYERLSRDCGGVPTPNRAQGMATKPMKSFPDVETMRGLSRGLNVSVTEVLMACASSLGLDVTTTDPAQNALVLHGAGRLPVPAQDALVETSRQMQFLAGV